jgi:tetratricopeptide (TPR) repeat protein
VERNPPRSGRILVAPVVIVLLALPASLAAQVPPAYASIVERYAHGDIKDAVVELAQWVDRRVGSIDQAIAVLPPTRLRAATMLHTDLAGAMAMIGDTAGTETQLRTANRILDRWLSQNHDDSATFASYWYAFASSIYVAEGLLDRARALADNGLYRFPRSSELYVARGIVGEMVARQAEMDPRVATLGPSGSFARRFEQLLTSASGNFERAIELDKANAVAHLHRGWTLHQAGDHRAEHEIDLALENASDDGVRYLAHLILGAVAESRKDLDAAASEYQAAWALGGGQTACVALSRVEIERGHIERSHDIVDEFARRHEHTEDPWWNLRVGGFDGAALAWLRTEAQRP